MKKFTTLEYVKAARRGSREAELEDSTGFTRKQAAHTSKKTYKRKPKHPHTL
jgi:hypothetical protein